MDGPGFAKAVTCKPFKCSLGQAGFLGAVRLQIQREPKVVCNKGGETVTDPLNSLRLRYHILPEQ